MNMKQDKKHSKTFRILSKSPIFQDELKNSFAKIVKAKNNQLKRINTEAIRIYSKYYLPVGYISAIKKYLQVALKHDASPALQQPELEHSCASLQINRYGKFELSLKLSARARKKDVDRAFKYGAKKFQKLMPRMRVQEFDETDEKIYIWRAQGKTSEWLLSESGGKLSLQYPNWTEHDINKRYYKMKRLFGIPKKSKKS